MLMKIYFKHRIVYLKYKKINLRRIKVNIKYIKIRLRCIFNVEIIGFFCLKERFL